MLPNRPVEPQAATRSSLPHDRVPWIAPTLICLADSMLLVTPPGGWARHNALGQNVSHLGRLPTIRRRHVGEADAAQPLGQRRGALRFAVNEPHPRPGQRAEHPQ